MRKAIEAKICQIAGDILKSDVDSSSLYEGLGGNCLFLSNFIYCFPENESANQASNYVMAGIHKIISEIQNKSLDFSMSNGVTGVAWALSYFHGNRFLALKDVDIFFGELDEYIFTWGKQCYQNKNFDLFNGGTGAMVYLLGRNVVDHRHKIRIENLLQIIENKAEMPTTNEIRWEDGISKRINHRYIAPGVIDKSEYCLGLAHGNASIISILCKVYSLKIQEERCLRLIESAAKWLYNQRLNDDSSSLFPYYVTEPKEICNGSRLGWCHGDLGIANALWICGETTGKDFWKKQAIDIMFATTKRRTISETKVIDAGLCHGASGIAYFYSLFYQRTKIQEFKDSMDYWLKTTLKMANFEDGAVGFKAYNGDSESWERKYGLLTGISGIGLALMSCLIPDKRLPWDKCMLFSI